jgi:predicted ferric reductase
MEKESGDAISVYITGRNLMNFQVKPGQFLIFRFLNKTYWWQHHPFSASYIPKNNMLRITVKNSGDFTGDINSMKKGTPVMIDGPYGTFTIPQSNLKKYVFIAGGIGITPIRSLIEQTAPDNDIVVLYTSKTPTEFSLQKELDELANIYHFPITYIVTQDDTYKGEKGRIDDEKIKRLVPDYMKREVYLCGPVAMMEGIKKVLISIGVEKGRIHYEKFSLH